MIQFAAARTLHDDAPIHATSGQLNIAAITSRDIASFRDHRHSLGLAPATVNIDEVRPRKDHRGVNLISDALPFGRLWYDGPGAVGNAIGYAEHRSRSHPAVIRVFDEAGNVIETHEHAGDFREAS